MASILNPRPALFTTIEILFDHAVSIKLININMTIFSSPMIFYTNMIISAT